MKTITKKKDFIYIVYDEELLKKNYTSIQYNIMSYISIIYFRIL